MMSGDLRIRRFESGDAGRVWQLHNEALISAGAHLGNGPWDEDLHSIKATYLDAGGEFLVGIYANELVAMGAIRPRAGFGELKRMRVEPAHHRQGFGRAMLRQLERRASELGFARLRLDTTTEQLAAQALYQSEGWTPTGEELRVGRVDVLFFEKHLASVTGGATGAR